MSVRAVTPVNRVYRFADRPRNTVTPSSANRPPWSPRRPSTSAAGTPIPTTAAYGSPGAMKSTTAVVTVAAAVATVNDPVIRRHTGTRAHPAAARVTSAHGWNTAHPASPVTRENSPPVKNHSPG